MSVSQGPADARAWYVYLLRGRDQSLYTGITTDMDRRLREHNHSATRMAKSLRGKRPLTVAYATRVCGRGVALRLEYAIKRLPRNLKERLVAGDIDIQTLLAGQ